MKDEAMFLWLAMQIERIYLDGTMTVEEEFKILFVYDPSNGKSYDPPTGRIGPKTIHRRISDAADYEFLAHWSNKDDDRTRTLFEQVMRKKAELSRVPA